MGEGGLFLADAAAITVTTNGACVCVGMGVLVGEGCGAPGTLMLDEFLLFKAKLSVFVLAWLL
jgi:hypothetical protein